MSKIASWFIQATVAIKYDKILQINEEAVPDNGKNVFCLLMNIMSCGQFT